jgi:hypothetical protein
MEPTRESNFTESIFDLDTSGEYKLWKSCSRSESLYQKLINKPVLLEGFVGKRSSRGSSQNKIQNRYFVLTNGYLYFKKRQDSTKISGYLKLRWARMEVHTEDYENEAGQVKSKFTIKIIKNLKFTSMFFDDYNDFFVWKQAFIKVNLIQTDFHEKFKVLERIGKGSFAKVRMIKIPFLTKFLGLQGRQQ